MSLARTLRMIRFEHSVFALPFALAGAWLAADGTPPAADLAGIVVAAVAARSAAMGFNRIVDRGLDAANPRTAGRELVTGALSVRYAAGFVAACAAVFVAASFWLAPVCGWLSLPVLAVLLGYSWLKRWTWLSHAGLGLALGLAPAGAWLAVRKEFAPGWGEPVWVGTGVIAWVAGFDLLYALQDAEHDRSAGLHAVPARFGAGAARAASALLFVAALALWGAAGAAAALGPRYHAGLALVAALLAAEHLLLRGSRVERVPVAFFRVNAWVGVAYFAALWWDVSAAAGRGSA